MKSVRSILKVSVFVAIVLCCLLIGCVTERQYRTSGAPAAYDPAATNASRAMIEFASNYSLGYVEFDDQGWLYGAPKMGDPTEIDTVLKWIKSEGDTNGLLIVVFVHGWKHNASGLDANVQSFHGVLDELGGIEQEFARLQPQRHRKVIGIFVGWRGLSRDIEPLEELSFWGRKDAAEVVGHGAVIELLSRLEDTRDQINGQHRAEIASHARAASKLLILGHSFGGDIVYSATAPVLMERMAENLDANGVRQSPRSLGDLVVLLNPAFEAARFQELQNLAATKAASTDHSFWFPPGTNCTLAIFTSTADWATGLAFPIGRRLSTALVTYDSKRQASENVTAVGHFEPLITHTLKPLTNGGVVTRLAIASNVVSSSARILAFMTQAGRRTNEIAFDFPGARLAPTAHCVPNDPVFNVAVDPAFIPDHDTIFQTNFVQFLAQFLFVFSSSGEK